MEGDELVKFKVVFSGKVVVTFIETEITFEGFLAEIKEMCYYDETQNFTIKWLDDEGDPCLISSETELVEAIRLYELNKDSEILIHIFPNIPLAPGLLCQGEDFSFYKYRLRRWKKFYRYRGHLFEVKRFSRKAVCSHCLDLIWGLGRQGLKCIVCKLFVHKKCHRSIRLPCNIAQSETDLSSHLNFDTLDLEQFNIINNYNGAFNHLDSNLDNYQNFELDHSKKQAAGFNTNRRLSNKFGVEDYFENVTQSPCNLSQFDLLKVIGRGSYAKVFLVQYKFTKRYYAMKVIKKELVNDDADMDWVQTEKHVFEVASNHPFLVGLHSCFQTNSRLFFVIELVSGGDMMYHMQQNRKLAENHVRFYSAEISLALDYLHEKGIIYRDLKLDNVLLDCTGHIKLTDYGMCKEGMTKEDRTNTFCGTPNYVAPEILKGEPYGYSIDWWALGVLMFEMLAGRSPFDVAEQTNNPDLKIEDFLFQVILEQPIRIPRSLSNSAISVLKGFLNKNPRERLACNSEKSSMSEIKSHSFYRGINWELLLKKEIEPPYIPQSFEQDGIFEDKFNFDPVFTSLPPVLTPDDPQVIRNIDQSEFEGFDYINPLLMSSEDRV